MTGQNSQLVARAVNTLGTTLFLLIITMASAFNTLGPTPLLLITTMVVTITYISMKGTWIFHNERMPINK